MSEHTADPARSGENQFGTAFAEADRRLAAMHGYAPAQDWCRGECIGVNWLATYREASDA